MNSEVPGLDRTREVATAIRMGGPVYRVERRELDSPYGEEINFVSGRREGITGEQQAQHGKVNRDVLARLQAEQAIQRARALVVKNTQS